MKIFTFFLCAIFMFGSMLKSFGAEALPQTIISPIDGVPMALIPASEFLRGTTQAQLDGILRIDPSLESESLEDEQPARWIYLDDYYIDKYEVTVRRYRKFIGATGYPEPDWVSIRYFSPTDNHPVTYVSWEDAVAYAEWAGKSLVTEAQWEKAARGGLEGKLYPWGDELTREDANYLGVEGRDKWDLTTSPVGSFPPNGYDIYDMAGNVLEWILDWYDADYYQYCPKENPVNLTPTRFRVMRGGAWCFEDEGLRCASRFIENPLFRGADREGFRCVLNVSQGSVPVEPTGRLATTWGTIKKVRN
ncbi:formylglycine-generating enzyme family protein [Candidatus Poribacteria bacterium]|nr:formylglycine-generating enzyme family protein [Candidatus Poribacteria bacterium]